MSSYKKNNYGEVLYSIVTSFDPRNAVELGVLDGYSASWIGKGLKRNGEGCLDCWDLWDGYDYKHGDIEKVQEVIDAQGLSEQVKLHTGDAFKVHENYVNNSIYLLHIDISNTGDKIRDLMELWDPKLMYGSRVIIEGGTEERDKVGWMVKYDMPPIKPELESNKLIREKYVYGTYLDYPGLTVMIRKSE